MPSGRTLPPCGCTRDRAGPLPGFSGPGDQVKICQRKLTAVGAAEAPGRIAARKRGQSRQPLR
jgi:hypothetical protein